MILAGLPATTVLLGTSFMTTLPIPIKEFFPIVIGPTMQLCGEIVHPDSIVGAFPFFSPIVVLW